MDVVLLIGYLIQQEHYTEEEVVKYLLDEHGITISQPSLNNYKRTALALGGALIMGNEEKIKSGLDELPFRVYSIAGLNSNRSRTLFIIRDIISGTVLGAALLDKHDADAIHDFMEAIFQKFGTPDYLVGDGERGLIGAICKYYSDIPYQYCHRHFLNNMGKALMDDIYKELKKIDWKGALKQVRSLKLTLNERICALTIPPPLEFIIQEIFELLSIFESLLSRSLKDVFPFYLKYVELYRQLSKMRSTVSSRIESLELLASHIHIDIQFLIDPLEGLDRITRKIVDDSELSNLVRELE
ncbi:MAG: hypothetical protein ACTSRG_21560 [Candidatus Helarchaeota archaeon]